MCARYTLSKEEKELQAAYAAKIPDGFLPQPHVAITNTSLVITSDMPDQFQKMHFEIIPHIAKEKKEFKKYSLFNAKAEEVMSKRIYRPLLVNHKTCIIPADGFIEWHTSHSGKQPYHIFIKDREIFSFAGLWSKWVDPATNDPYYSFAIMTTQANPFVAKIHNTKERMPVILNKEDEQLWLSKDVPPAELLKLCRTYPNELMDAREMPKKVNVEKSENGDFQFPRNSQ
jgi:putative SOS response-associated peptidase YedK